MDREQVEAVRDQNKHLRANVKDFDRETLGPESAREQLETAEDAEGEDIVEDVGDDEGFLDTADDATRGAPPR